MIKSTKIVLVLAALVAAFASASATQAATCGSTGSPTNHAGSCETSSGDLRCGGTETGAGPSASAGAGGVELCAEDGELPIEGRVGVDFDCECIYADGGDSNDPPANGWLRIDSTGPNCGDGTKPSYNQGGGSSANCG